MTKTRRNKTQARTKTPAVRPRRPATLWHLPFGVLVEERRPRWIEVHLEVLVQRESQRLDQLYVLHALHPRDPADQGRVMRGLWPHITAVGVAEFKSTARPFRKGDLRRLIGCGWNWLHKHPECAPSDLVLVLIVTDRSATLLEELVECRAELVALGDGYHRAHVGALGLLVVELDVVSEAEKDDYLRAFSHHDVQTEEVVEWLHRHSNILEAKVLDPSQLVGKEDIIRKIQESIPLRHRLDGLDATQREELAKILKPEERLSGLKPEERLAGLSESDQVLALPDHLLRLLPEDYIATLPADTQTRVRARRGR